MEYAGGGDPARTMALLWRTAQDPPPARRGPKQRLDLDRIVDRAIELTGSEGLEAVSMRRLAQVLGIGTSSLYTYLPGKAELLELMVDRVTGSQPLPSTATGWRAGLESYARSGLDLHRRHPWLLQIATARTVLGPHVVTRYDAAVGLLAGTGLHATQVELCIATVDSYLRGAASEVVEAEQAPTRTGRSDDEWWQAYAPILDRHLAAGNFPNLVALDSGGAFVPPEGDAPYTVRRALARFEFGLALVLDAIDRLVDTAPSRATG